MPLSRAQQFAAFVESLEGGEVARVSSIAFFALFVYEYFLTLDQELKYFWSGRWTATRVLFYFNRYLPPMIMMLGLMCFFVPNPTNEVCGPAIKTSFIANIGAIGIIQAVLVIRVWYLFQGNGIVRWAVFVSFLASLVTSLAFSFIAAYDLQLLPKVGPIVGCRAARPDAFWRMFFPSLLLHTLLYVLTAYRALRNRRVLGDAPVLKKLLWDGGFFFLVVFVSVSFTAVGSFLTQYPKINIPIVFSNYLIAVTSIAVSRVLFSIHSLAENLGSETAWLLNNAELNRTDWKKGATEGEIIIERWTAEADDSDSQIYDKADEEWGTIGTPTELSSVRKDSWSLDPPSPIYSNQGRLGRNSPLGCSSPVKMTKIGMYNESNWY